MALYRVLRAMEGDRLYREGETRDLAPTDALHLVRLGALEPVEGNGEPAPLTKAEPAPENKARQPRKTKG